MRWARSSLPGCARTASSWRCFPSIVCSLCVGTALAITLVMGWDAGTGAGLLAGANTTSIIIGIASDTLNGIAMDPAQRQAMLDNIPMAYAVTYIFGTAGTAWFLVAIGTKLLDKDVKARCQELKASMGAAGGDDVRTAHERVGYRAYRLAQLPARAPCTTTVAELEQYLAAQGHPAFVVRVAQGDEQRPAAPETVLHPDDVVVVMARHEFLPAMERLLGPEVARPGAAVLPDRHGAGHGHEQGLGGPHAGLAARRSRWRAGWGCGG